MSRPLVLAALLLSLAAFGPPDCAHDDEEFMSTPYAGDPDLFPDTIPVPDGSDRNYASVFSAAYEGLANRTAWLRARLLDPILVPLFDGFTVDPRFAPDATNNRWGWLQVAVDDTGTLLWHVQINPAVRITSIVASLDGDDGPGTNPGFPDPADRPLFRAYRQPTDGTAWTLLATAADESASKAAYEAHHTIVMDPGVVPGSWPAEFAEDEYLVLEFIGHKGAQVGASTLKLYGLQINVELVP